MRTAPVLSPAFRSPLRARVRRSAVGLAVLHLMALALTPPVQAMDAYWAGGEGAWTDSAAWVDGLVPDYADRAFIDALADPAAMSTVWVDGSVAASQVFIGAGDALRIRQGSLTLHGGLVSSQGVLRLQGSPATGAASLNLAANTTLAGGGSTVLTHQDYSYVYGNGHTLTVGAGHTLRGAGYLGADGNLNVVNKGSVIAEGGVLRLLLGEGRSFNNVAGTVTVADGAVLSLDSGSFNGGTITGQANAQLTGGGIYRDTQLAGQLQVAAGTNLRLAGTIANTGTLTVQGSPSTGSAAVSLAADTTLAGSGSTVLTHQDYSYVYGNGHTLTIGQGHTLRGAGYLGADGNLDIVNQGSLVAEGGRLSAYLGSSQTLDNTAGAITVAQDGRFNLENGRLIGGVVHGQAGAQLSGSGTYENTRLTGSLQAAGNLTLKDSLLQGPLQVLAGSSLGLAGTLTNTGTLTVQGSPYSGAASLSLAADTTMAGSGSTVLTHQDYSYVYGNGHTLTIGAGHTLRGVGYLGADGNLNVVNQGAVVAEGGVLRLLLGEGRSFNNIAGTVSVADGATLSLDSGSLSGGTITGQGQAQLTGGGLYQDMQLAGRLRVAAGTSLRLAGTLTNTGTLTVEGSPYTGGANLNLAADTTLAGSGNTVLTHQDYSYVYGNGHTLTIAAGHTLRGAGYLGADGNINVVNQGSLLVEGGRLSVYPGSDRTVDNSTGTVTVASDGVFSLENGRLIGGLVHGQGGAQLAGAGTYDTTRLTGSFRTASNLNLKDSRLEGQLQVLGGGSIGLAGTLTNTGTLTVQGSPFTGGAYMALAADTTLAGSGNTVLMHQDYSYIYGNGHTLTIGQGHTLRGAGYIGLNSNINVVDQGSLIAEGGRLTVQMQAGQSFDNTAGVIRVDETGQILLYGDLLLGDASQLVFDVAGVSGQAAWGGLSWYAPATFDGTLRLNFEGYTPTVGQQFSLIQYSGSYSGAFDAALANGYTLSLSYADNLVVATVTGVSPVPEPGTWALWLAGAAALGAVVRRRSRQDRA